MLACCFDVFVHAVSCRALPCVCGCLQAFQCSEQAVTLCKDGWFCPETEPSGVSKMRNPKEPSVTQPLIVVSECLCCVPEGTALLALVVAVFGG